MGLDIAAYSKLTKIEGKTNEDGEPLDPKTGEVMDWNCYTHLYPNPHFQERAGSITEGNYTFEDQMGFRAGSYSGYNYWREQLAKMAGYPAIEVEKYGNKEIRHDAGAWEKTEGPFWELICFSDCEGIVGTEDCVKLAKDFAENQEKVGSMDDGNPHGFAAKYSEWRKAFELASDGGCVDFH